MYTTISDGLIKYLLECGVVAPRPQKEFVLELVKTAIKKELDIKTVTQSWNGNYIWWPYYTSGTAEDYTTTTKYPQ